ncbi:hypothetical protein ACFLZV_03450, partial [Candidatus Margulisiibacteriota bacterium]
MNIKLTFSPKMAEKLVLNDFKVRQKLLKEFKIAINITGNDSVISEKDIKQLTTMLTSISKFLVKFSTGIRSKELKESTDSLNKLVRIYGKNTKFDFSFFPKNLSDFLNTKPVMEKKSNKKNKIHKKKRKSYRPKLVKLPDNVLLKMKTKNSIGTKKSGKGEPDLNMLSDKFKNKEKLKPIITKIPRSKSRHPSPERKKLTSRHISPPKRLQSDHPKTKGMNKFYSGDLRKQPLPKLEKSISYYDVDLSQSNEKNINKIPRKRLKETLVLKKFVTDTRISEDIRKKIAEKLEQNFENKVKYCQVFYKKHYKKKLPEKLKQDLISKRDSLRKTKRKLIREKNKGKTAVLEKIINLQKKVKAELKNYNGIKNSFLNTIILKVKSSVRKEYLVDKTKVKKRSLGKRQRQIAYSALKLAGGWKKAQALYKEGFPQLMWDIWALRKEIVNEMITNICAELNEDESLKDEKVASFTKGIHNKLEVGSIEIGSDKDVILVGPFAARAVRMFNERFPVYFGYESGYLFDTNAYIIGSLLPVTLPEPKEPGKYDPRAQKYKKMFEDAEKLLESPEFSEKKEALLEEQIKYALVKVAKYYTSGTSGGKDGLEKWLKLLVSNLDILPKKSKIYKMWGDCWEDIDNLPYSEFQEKYEKKGISEREINIQDQFNDAWTILHYSNIKENKKRFKDYLMDDKQFKLIKKFRGAWEILKTVESNITRHTDDTKKEDRELAAYNKLYNTYLTNYDQVLHGSLYKALMQKQSNKSFKSNVVDNYIKLKKAQFNLLLYANEPYYTQETLRDVVLSWQMGLTTTLPAKSYLISLIENFGNYHEKFPKKLIALEYILCMKYLFRCSFAAEKLMSKVKEKITMQMKNKAKILKLVAWNSNKLKSLNDPKLKKERAREMLEKSYQMLQENTKNPKSDKIIKFVNLGEKAMKKEAEIEKLRKDISRILRILAKEEG